tara:strand:- start:899 stop:1888 length:990 start_codon:yes stop_codon:yes gene_type:complete
MDYINYVKQYPLSLTGMGGIIGGLAFAGVGYDTTEINAGDRGIIAGGAENSSNKSTKILSFDITTTGNATDSNKDIYDNERQQGCSNGTRAVVGGGGNPYTNQIHYFNIPGTITNSSDFGDLTKAKAYFGCLSDGGRAVWGGGYDGTGPALDDMDYVSIMTTGNAADFGNLLAAQGYGPAGLADTTRGVWAAGNPNTSQITYITVQTLSNSAFFGSMDASRFSTTGCASATRGVWGGGDPSNKNDIDYVTIQTTGNTTDFGNLTVGRTALGACSNYTRGVFCGGNYPPGGLNYGNYMDYITIASTGNATDFGDTEPNTGWAATLSGAAS